MSAWPPANIGASNVFRQSYFPSFVDISGQTIMRGDVSMNSRLFVNEGIKILNSRDLNLVQQPGGSTSTIQWTNYAEVALGLIYASTSSLALNFNVQPTLTNGFRFLSSGVEKARISTDGLLSCPGVIITDATTNPATATTGSLVIKHTTSGGSSSIVFPSAVNAGSDYGYIQYSDNRGSGGENAKLTIGTSNDGDDDLHLSPSGGVYVNCNSYYSDWIRSTGDTGIYWNAWGGGWHMNDSTYMRCYNDKTVYTAAAFQQGQLGGGLTMTTVADSIYGEYISRFVLKQNNGYIECVKWNSNKTSNQGGIGINFFNSDQRLKENFKEPLITNICSYIEKIEIQSFQWKQRECCEHHGICELGIIAQQLESIYPNLINTMDDIDTFGDGVGTKAVNTNVFSTFMMKGIQELIAENKSLKSEIQKIKEYLNIV